MFNEDMLATTTDKSYNKKKMQKSFGKDIVSCDLEKVLVVLYITGIRVVRNSC